jgi:hypothetical protein
MLWAGRVMTALPAAMFLLGGVISLLQPKFAVEGFVKYGYPDGLMPILGVTEFVCAVLYIIPQTAVLGAILLTGYLGGAVDTHVHAGEPQWLVPIVFGVLVWGGLFLRDARIRALIPLRK